MSQSVRAPRFGANVHPDASVHPTAIIDGDVSIGPGTVVGPGCIILGTLGPVRIGTGCTLVARAIVNGPVTIGDGNVLYPNSCIGFAPQETDFDPQSAGAGCIIGNRNTFREGATVHRGTGVRPTQMGDSNYWMTNTHLGHGGSVGSHCIFASACVIAAHVEVGDRVIIGGCTAIHQFVRLGRGSFVSGAIGLGLDLPPWFMATGNNLAASVNLVGLRRSGATAEDVHDVRWCFKAIYRSGGTPQQAVPALLERASRPAVAECLAFITSTKRGICHGLGHAGRGTGGAAAAKD